MFSMLSPWFTFHILVKKRSCISLSVASVLLFNSMIFLICVSSKYCAFMLLIFKSNFNYSFSCQDITSPRIADDLPNLGSSWNLFKYWQFNLTNCTQFPLAGFLPLHGTTSWNGLSRNIPRLRLSSFSSIHNPDISWELLFVKSEWHWLKFSVFSILCSLTIQSPSQMDKNTGTTQESN